MVQHDAIRTRTCLLTPIELHSETDVFHRNESGGFGLFVYQHVLLDLATCLRQVVYFGKRTPPWKYIFLGRSDPTTQIYVPSFTMVCLCHVFILSHRHPLCRSSPQETRTNDRDGHSSNSIRTLLWCYLCSFWYDLSRRNSSLHTARLGNSSTLVVHEQGR